MSAIDPVAVLLGRLEQPVSPRPEFTDALLTRLLGELREGPAPSGARGPRFALPRLFPGVAPRLRLVLIVIALLLLLAGVATATYFGVKTWISAGPRGVQYASDYRLSVIFKDPPGRSGLWSNLQLEPDGSGLYALRYLPPWPHRRVELVRFANVATAARVHPERVLLFDRLAQPRLWDPGTELAHAVISVYGPPAISPAGDIFLLAGAWRSNKIDASPPLGISLIVRRNDGSLEKVLTGRELVRSGAVGGSWRRLSLGIAATAPDVLWLKVQSFEPPVVKPGFYSQFGVYSFLQVIDPNRDGDWGDRVIRRVAVPASLPVSVKKRGTNPWNFAQIVAGPSANGDDRARSILVSAVEQFSGQFRIYRIGDRDGDGDALDRGEVERVFTTRLAGADRPPPRIAPRVVVKDGKLVLREIIAAGLTLPTRLSRISQSGKVTDFGRAFEVLEDAAAAADGRIYTLVQVSGGKTCCAALIYRFEPRLPSTTAAGPAPAAARTLAASTTRGATAPPRIAFAIESSDFSRGRIVVLRADGRRGVRTLVPGTHNHGFCESADGQRMAYFSDQVAPHELFLYLADADGSHARKLTERQVGFWCGFGTRWFVITEQTGSAMTLIRHDLRTGREIELVKNVDRGRLSPDGNTILYVGGLDFGGGIPPAGKETLDLQDLNTLQRRRLDGPLAQGSYDDMTWSRDGWRLAYVAGSSRYPLPGHPLSDATPPAPRVLTVRDVRTGSAVLRLRLTGGPPSVSWSPDGKRLLVCLPAHGATLGCSDGLPRGKPSSRLLLIDLARRTQRVVARGELLWAGWSPTGAYGYATPSAIFVVSPDGRRHTLAAAPQRTRAGGWLGFSPDGRYIGLGDFSSWLGVADVSTGKVHVLLRERKIEFVEYRKWWR